MMSERRRIPAWVVMILAGVLCPGTAFGWHGFVHWRIAKAVAGVDPDYAMGPDTFRSYDSLFVITSNFAWSHAVQTTDLDLPPPEIPTYPHDGRYPGKVMYELVTNKLRPSTLASLQQGGGNSAADPLATAKGYLVHNASDNIVHWSYFLGGDTPAGCDQWPWWMWQTNHAFKEEWANYVVLVLLDGHTSAGGPLRFFQGPGTDGVMGTGDDIFTSLTEDANGNMILDPGEDQDGNGMLTDYTSDVFGPVAADGQRHLQPYLFALNPLNFKTNAGLQHLAMKVYRKNRRMTDVGSGGSESSEFEVQNLAAIQAAWFANIVDPAGASAIRDLQIMTLARFMELNASASEVNFEASTGCPVGTWDPMETMLKFNQCVARSVAWLANVGN